MRTPEYGDHPVYDSHNLTGRNRSTCACRPGDDRDNCPRCEGTGQAIDFAAIRAHNLTGRVKKWLAIEGYINPNGSGRGDWSEALYKTVSKMAAAERAMTGRIGVDPDKAARLDLLRKAGMFDQKGGSK